MSNTVALRNVHCSAALTMLQLEGISIVLAPNAFLARLLATVFSHQGPVNTNVHKSLSMSVLIVQLFFASYFYIVLFEMQPHILLSFYFLSFTHVNNIVRVLDKSHERPPSTYAIGKIIYYLENRSTSTLGSHIQQKGKDGEWWPPRKAYMLFYTTKWILKAVWSLYLGLAYTSGNHISTFLIG